MNYLEYKGYKGTVEYSQEDDCLLGKVLGLGKHALILYEGSTLEELRKDFQESIDEYLEDCAADGIEPAKPYSGHINLRMTSDTHSRVAEMASRTGTSINDYINRAILTTLTADQAAYGRQ